MKTFGLLALWALAASSANAQGSLYSIHEDGSGFFDWDAIRTCAAEKIPAPSAAAQSNMLSPEYKQFDFDFRRIENCRLMLIARHEGWKAGARQPSNAADPFPPEPMMQKDDMK